MQVKFDEKGLVPAIVQNALTGKILMQAYMNREAYEKTLAEDTVWFYSRSRSELWNKGATSGNFLKKVSVCLDCDGDSVLVQAIPLGPACHTGSESCFFNEVCGQTPYDTDSVFKLYETILERKAQPQQGSYTSYLFEKGIDKILKKVGEETSEVIIASKNHDKAEITYEVCDLIYHVLVLLANEGVRVEDVLTELSSRHGKPHEKTYTLGQ